jgi:hypothetical protein
MNISHKSYAFAFVLLAGALSTDAMAQTFGCGSPANRATAVAESSILPISTNFVGPNGEPQFQPILTAAFINTQPGCLIAHLSGIARITDNAVIFQIRLDGQPITAGQQFLGATKPDTPVTFVTIDSGAAPYDDEQYIDPHKVVAYNFFDNLPAGKHTVEVYAAAGWSSNPYLSNFSTLSNLVLTLEHP